MPRIYFGGLNIGNNHRQNRSQRAVGTQHLGYIAYLRHAETDFMDI